MNTTVSDVNNTNTNTEGWRDSKNRNVKNVNTRKEKYENVQEEDTYGNTDERQLSDYTTERIFNDSSSDFVMNDRLETKLPDYDFENFASFMMKDFPSNNCKHGSIHRNSHFNQDCYPQEQKKNNIEL